MSKELHEVLEEARQRGVDLHYKRVDRVRKDPVKIYRVPEPDLFDLLDEIKRLQDEILRFYAEAAEADAGIDI
jgi:hypothetical protein